MFSISFEPDHDLIKSVLDWPSIILRLNLLVYLENNGGKLILVPNLDIPEASSAGDISALIEGPNSIPTPVVDVFILPGQYFQSLWTFIKFYK